MAENKKSFVLYADLIHTVRKMPVKKAGELFMTILSYVNDENPIVSDPLVDLVFEPVKQQLKRDLKAWEETRVERSAAGKAGGIKSGESRRNKANEASASKSKQNEANEAVTVTVNGNVNVTAEEVGSVRVKEVANEVWKDQHWKESVCMGLNITPEELKMWLAQFNASLAGDKISDFDKSKYKKLSRGWIVKQQEKGAKLQVGPAKKSDSAPLTIIQHGN